MSGGQKSPLRKTRGDPSWGVAVGYPPRVVSAYVPFIWNP